MGTWTLNSKQENWNYPDEVPWLNWFFGWLFRIWCYNCWMFNVCFVYGSSVFLFLYLLPQLSLSFTNLFLLLFIFGSILLVFLSLGFSILFLSIVALSIISSLFLMLLVIVLDTLLIWETFPFHKCCRLISISSLFNILHFPKCQVGFHFWPLVH